MQSGVTRARTPGAQWSKWQAWHQHGVSAVLSEPSKVNQAPLIGWRVSIPSSDWVIEVTFPPRRHYRHSRGRHVMKCGH